ncbi:MAG: leucine--tRNA ligase [Clostridia bacterium]
MDMSKVEKKWQQRWNETKVNTFDKNDVENKHYVLEMFSYPSAAKLHIGHWYNYGPSDSYARFMRMKGKNVFQPMGFDAFGLPAENFAIKTGIHPKDSTYKNIATMETQLQKIGGMFDWDNEIKTCDPDYYKWTQWMFLQLYKNGLAYRKEAPVNWCPSCQTVLANEQVKEGVCERCGAVVEKKNLTQWFFKITNYAEELLTDLDKLDWPQKTKLMQKNWIGKSVGGEVDFTAESGDTLTVFTTRADTLFGVSFVVLAPEHPLVAKLTTPENKAIVEEYIAKTKVVSEIERLSTAREKTGVFTGAYAINPVNGERVPILVADYVLFSYGTGVVMGVASHDERDYDFAIKHNIPIKRVVKGIDCDDTLPFTEYGVLVDSGKYDGMKSQDAITAILTDLESENKGRFKVNYRLRDWLVSRQRYWGAPIPIIHCDHCGDVPVPEDQLPVELPYDVEFRPDGKSPLAKCDSFVNTVCPVCGRPAKRDVDTLDTFVCSSWYYLRYPDNKNKDMAFDPEIINKILPVDKYIGGAEHACMHLLYARFFTKALRDLGYLTFDEPFTSLVHQGLILGPDGEKMSKSRGNVVSPDEFVEEYGSDVFRMYLMFGFSYIEGGAWNDDGIKAIARFLDRVERIVDKYNTIQSVNPSKTADAELEYVLHNTINCMTNDIQVFSFNTAIARLMELTNALYKYDKDANINVTVFKDALKNLVLLIAPFTPHFAEELWERIGGKFSIFNESYPTFNKEKLVKDEVEIAVQINSKIRGKIVVSSAMSDDEIKQQVIDSGNFSQQLENKKIVKVIVVKGRLINIICA